MKIELGKEYLTRDDGIAVITDYINDPADDPEFRYCAKGTIRRQDGEIKSVSWTKEGRYFGTAIPSVDDLIAEYTNKASIMAGDVLKTINGELEVTILATDLTDPYPILGVYVDPDSNKKYALRWTKDGKEQCHSDGSPFDLMPPFPTAITQVVNLYWDKNVDFRAGRAILGVIHDTEAEADENRTDPLWIGVIRTIELGGNTRIEVIDK